MDTPNMLRGEFYNTHLRNRCHDFQQCPLCKMCVRFCQHEQKCVVCENRKRPTRHCICTQSQKNAVVKIQEKLGMALFDPNIRKDKQGVVRVADTSRMDDWDALVESLGFRPSEEKK